MRGVPASVVYDEEKYKNLSMLDRLYEKNLKGEWIMFRHPLSTEIRSWAKDKRPFDYDLFALALRRWMSLEDSEKTELRWIACFRGTLVQEHCAQLVLEEIPYDWA